MRPLRGRHRTMGQVMFRGHPRIRARRAASRNRPRCRVEATWSLQPIAVAWLPFGLGAAGHDEAMGLGEGIAIFLMRGLGTCD